MGKEKMTKLEKQWVLYDVGNSAFVMLVSTIIPIYFKNMATASGISAANSTAYLSYAISISTILVALLGPVCGAAADNKGFKKPLFTAFMMIGVIACAAMGIPKTWLAFLVVFVIAKVGFSGSLIFYDSMQSFLMLQLLIRLMISSRLRYLQVQTVRTWVHSKSLSVTL